MKVLAGQNDQLEVRKRRYHVQTEADPSGRSICTHVFLGGAVVASRRSSFAELVATELSQAEVHGRVQELIRRQHQSTLVDLASGRLAGTEVRAPAAPAVEADPAGHPDPVAATLAELRGLEGFIGACLVDAELGLVLEHIGLLGVDVEAAGAANAEVIRAKNQALRRLGLEDRIEDILVTLGGQYHLIRPLPAEPDLFVYLAIDRSGADLGLARHVLAATAGKLRLKESHAPG